MVFFWGGGEGGPPFGHGHKESYRDLNLKIPPPSGTIPEDAYNMQKYAEICRKYALLVIRF